MARGCVKRFDGGRGRAQLGRARARPKALDKFGASDDLQHAPILNMTQRDGAERVSSPSRQSDANLRQCKTQRGGGGGGSFYSLTGRVKHFL